MGVGQIWHWQAPAGIKSYINRCTYQTYLLHVGHLLVLVGTCKQTFSWYRSWYRGADYQHGDPIPCLAYHALRNELFLVFVACAPLNRAAAGSCPLTLGTQNQVAEFTIPLETLGMRIKCGQQESKNV